MATTSATEPVPPPDDLLDVLRLRDPDYPTTRPLDWPVEVADAARIETDLPLRIDSIGRLWIAHPKGRTITELLKSPPGNPTRVADRLPLFADGSNVIAVADGGVVALMEADGTRPIAGAAAEWNWAAAATLGDDLLVPADTGVMRIDLEHLTTLPIAKLFDAPANDTLPRARNAVVIYSTGERAYAWAPFENDRGGSDRVMVFVADRTTPPAEVTGLVSRLIQLTPLADGTLLSIGTSEEETPVVAVRFTDALGLTRADAPTPDALRPVVERLSDLEPANREAAQRELEAMGPAIFPTLEGMHDELPVEAQLRVERVLGQRFAPTLAGITPAAGPVLTVSRFATGGCALKLPLGGTVFEDGGDRLVTPAYISVRPGRYVDRLSPVISDALVGMAKLYAWGNEFVVSDPAIGPRRWVGASLQNLLSKPLRHYDELIGIDATGRWLLSDPALPGRTLVLDRNLPDTTPRLPAWTVEQLDATGWSAAGMPMVVRNQQTFVLDENGWRAPKPGEKISAVVPTPDTTARAPDGATFAMQNGRLRVLPKVARLATLPTAPTGERAASQVKGRTPLMFFVAGRLFVQPEPGKLDRYRYTPGAPAPLTLEATFTRQIPASCRRVWVDPCGRIVFATEFSLTITFPTGNVPPRLANQVLIRGDRDDD